MQNSYRLCAFGIDRPLCKVHIVGMVKSFADLLSHWTAAELSAELGVNYNTAAAMKRRGSIAPSHWSQLIIAARGKSLTLDDAMLARFWRERKTQPIEAAD